MAWDPCCPVSRTPGLLPVRKGLLQKGGLLEQRWPPAPSVAAPQSGRP